MTHDEFFKYCTVTTLENKVMIAIFFLRMLTS